MRDIFPADSLLVIIEVSRKDRIQRFNYKNQSIISHSDGSFVKSRYWKYATFWVLSKL